MRQRIHDIWTHHKIAVAALIVVLTAAGVFGIKSAQQMMYWSDPAKADQPLQGWMTPRYVGRSYNVPPEVVQRAFALDDPGVPRRVSLETIAQSHGVTLTELQAQLDEAVAIWRADPEVRRRK